MSERDEYGVPHVPDGQLSPFANSLFGYLYFELDMHSYRVNTSEYFNEVIGRAVFYIRKHAYNFNTDVLNNCGYGVDRLTLCQEICSSYPNDDYFKKLYFITAFILDMVFWWHTNSDAVDLSIGPNLWITIFRNNFESEFEIHGGWQGLAEAGNECYELLPNEILPGETLLPIYSQAVSAAVRELFHPPEEVDLDESIATLASLHFGPMEIDDPSVDEAAQIEKSEDEIEENQPGKVAQVEESKEEIEESQPEEVDDRPSLHSPALGGNVVQTENPTEGTSEKSIEGALYSLGSRNRRKRRHDTLPKSDSDTEPDYPSPSKAKMDRK